MMQYVVVPADRRFHLEMLWFLSCEEVNFKHILKDFLISNDSNFTALVESELNDM